jgi:hypothetical protein
LCPIALRFQVKCRRSKFALSVDSSRDEVRVLSHRVGVTRRRHDKSVYIEFYNDGKKVFALFSDDVSEPVIKRIEPGYKAFKELIAEMRDYLDA